MSTAQKLQDLLIQANYLEEKVMELMVSVGPHDQLTKSFCQRYHEVMSEYRSLMEEI